MAKFAFTVPPLTGHINPTLSLGNTLLERGHEVAWISLEESLQQHLPEGGKLLCIQHEHEDLKKEESKKILDTIERKVVYGIDSIKYLYEEVLIPLNRYMEVRISKILDQYNPDLVINDHELFAGAIASYKSKIPYATSITAPAAVKVMKELPKIHEWIENKTLALQEACGLNIDENITRSNKLNLVFTSNKFFGNEETLSDQYHFVGPVIQGRPGVVSFDWNRFHTADYHHKILVSIGTTFDHHQKLDFFKKVIHAFKDQPIFVVVVSDPDLLNCWPKNFMVQSKIPQLELLSHLDAVICHGGHNTVSETLFNGLPLVVLPIAYDQQHVASRVSALEVGIKLNFKRFKAENLKKAIQELLNDTKYMKNAKEIQQSFNEAGGTLYAATLLEELLVAALADM